MFVFKTKGYLVLEGFVCISRRVQKQTNKNLEFPLNSVFRITTITITKKPKPYQTPFGMNVNSIQWLSTTCERCSCPVAVVGEAYGKQGLQWSCSNYENLTENWWGRGLKKMACLNGNAFAFSTNAFWIRHPLQISVRCLRGLVHMQLFSTTCLSVCLSVRACVPHFNVFDLLKYWFSLENFFCDKWAKEFFPAAQISHSFNLLLIIKFFTKNPKYRSGLDLSRNGLQTNW